MPWSVVEGDERCSAEKPWAVVADEGGDLEGCHASEAEARQQVEALYASEEGRSEERAEWSAAFINDLPDSAFACIDSGGDKDSDGKTVPRSNRHYPHHGPDGKVDAAHLANARARVRQEGTTSCGYDHLFTTHSLPSDEGRSVPSRPEGFKPPRDLLVRAQRAGYELRFDAPEEPPTMHGYLAVFNQWTEIESAYEGHFLERVAPGTFNKAFKEGRERVKVLFNHGQDPQIGDKVLGVASVLEEDDTGARFEVPLFDTSYNRDLIPGLRGGAYGSSFRFRVIREDRNPSPRRRSDNPDGLPERTITEVELPEFGPVTFPAYAGATAGVRSLSDEYLRSVLRYSPGTAPSVSAEAEPHPDSERRTSAYPPITVNEFLEKLRHG